MKTFHLLLFVIFGASLLNAQVINVPTDQSSIQAAIEAAAEGDTIIVEEGLYYENINFLGKAITLASHFILDGDTAHISKTIIDGSQATHPDSASVVLMISGEDTTSVLMGFTITGGKGSKHTMKYFGTNATGLYGGGVAINNSGGKILHNTIENNILEPGSNLEEILGGGLTAIVNNNHSLIIRANIIRNNSVSGPYANGGGAFLGGGRIVIEKNIISGNEVFSKNVGGGAGLFWADFNNSGVINEAIIRENIISHNIGKSESNLFLGGGVALNFEIGEESVKVYNNIITDNYSEGYGGGIYLYITQATLFNNTIWNNESKLGGNSIGILGPSNIEMFNNIIRSDAENNIPDFAFTDFGNSSCYFWYNILKEKLTEDKVMVRGNSYKEPVFLPDSYDLAEDSPGIGWGVDKVEIDGTMYFAPPSDMKGNK
ncbi:MAG: hypothetical protein QNK35_01450, partial [Bacteroides sp.]|nr:hypothetical protein [Bacteroides sp.]